MHNGRLIGIAFGSLLLLGTAACSDDKKTTATASSAGGTTTTAPEDKVTADADVATGLRNMVDEAEEVVAAGSDKSTADAKYEEAHELWEGVEGTVKKNEPDLYATIEEDLALLKAGAGNADKARSASTALAGHVGEYLTKHPG